ncbi:MAG: DNA-binding protein [Cytophagales bacterium]|nr:MAG: DNA-binding protein [Cytophagales bacterium]
MAVDKFVIDANILFSAVIRQKGLYEELIDHYVFYSPDFALLELQKYKQTILKKTRADPAKLREFTIRLFQGLIILPDFVISEESIKKARELCDDIDPKDVLYVALNEELQTVLLTRDKVLHNGLQDKGYDRVKLFDDFVREFTAQP